LNNPIDCIPAAATLFRAIVDSIDLKIQEVQCQRAKETKLVGFHTAYYYFEGLQYAFSMHARIILTKFASMSVQSL
jgi:hypothetical protein